MLDDTKLKNCGPRNASKFPLNENVKFTEQIILCDESHGRKTSPKCSISYTKYISKSHQ